MNEGEDLQAWKCHFSFTKADSEEYLRKFGNGTGLWCTDILVDKVKVIKDMSAFTPTHFRKAYELMALRGRVSKSKIRAMLNANCIRITSKAASPIFTVQEQQSIINWWNEVEEEKFFSRIVSRKLITFDDLETNEQGDKTGHIKEEKPNIDTSHMFHIEMLRTIQTGRLAPEGFEARVRTCSM